MTYNRRHEPSGKKSGRTRPRPRRLVSAEGSAVKIKRRDGRLFTVRSATLSEADRAFIRNWSTQRTAAGARAEADLGKGPFTVKVRRVEREGKIAYEMVLHNRGDTVLRNVRIDYEIRVAERAAAGGEGTDFFGITVRAGSAGQAGTWKGWHRLATVPAGETITLHTGGFPLERGQEAAFGMEVSAGGKKLQELPLGRR